MIHIDILQVQIEDFVKCLQKRRFFEAHEALEYIWFPLRNRELQEVKLLRGYINAAVSFELYARGRKEASQKVWKNFIKYQELIEDIHPQHKRHYKVAEIEILRAKKELF